MAAKYPFGMLWDEDYEVICSDTNGAHVLAGDLLLCFSFYFRCEFKACACSPPLKSQQAFRKAVIPVATSESLCLIVH